MENNRRIYRLSLPTADVHAFLGACEAAAWYAVDTGERVMTDDGPDGESILLVEPVARAEAHPATPLVH